MRKEFIIILLLMCSCVFAGIGIKSFSNIDIDSNVEGLSGQYMIVLAQSSSILNEHIFIESDDIKGQYELGQPIKITETRKDDYQLYETTDLKLIPEVAYVDKTFFYNPFEVVRAVKDFSANVEICVQKRDIYLANNNYKVLNEEVNQNYGLPFKINVLGTHCTVSGYVQSGIAGYYSDLRKGQSLYNLEYSFMQNSKNLGNVQISQNNNKDQYGQNDIVAIYQGGVSLSKTSAIPNARDGVGVYNPQKSWQIIDRTLLNDYMSQLNKIGLLSNVDDSNGVEKLQYDQVKNTFINGYMPDSFRDSTIVKNNVMSGDQNKGFFNIGLQKDVVGHEIKFLMKADHISLFIPSGEAKIFPISNVEFSEEEGLTIFNVNGQNVGDGEGTFSIGGKCENRLTILSTSDLVLDAQEKFSRQMKITGFNPDVEENVIEMCNICLTETNTDKQSCTTFQTKMVSADTCLIGDQRVLYDNNNAKIVEYTTSQCDYKTISECDLTTQKIVEVRERFFCENKDGSGSDDVTCKAILSIPMPLSKDITIIPNLSNNCIKSSILTVIGIVSAILVTLAIFVLTNSILRKPKFKISSNKKTSNMFIMISSGLVALSLGALIFLLIQQFWYLGLLALILYGVIQFIISRTFGKLSKVIKK